MIDILGVIRVTEVALRWWEGGTGLMRGIGLVEYSMYTVVVVLQVEHQG